MYLVSCVSCGSIWWQKQRFGLSSHDGGIPKRRASNRTIVRETTFKDRRVISHTTEHRHRLPLPAVCNCFEVGFAPVFSFFTLLAQEIYIVFVHWVGNPPQVAFFFCSRKDRGRLRRTFFVGLLSLFVCCCVSFPPFCPFFPCERRRFGFSPPSTPPFVALKSRAHFERRSCMAYKNAARPIQSLGPNVASSWGGGGCN